MNKKLIFWWLIVVAWVTVFVSSRIHNKVSIIDYDDLATWTDATTFTTQDYACEKKCHENKKSCITNIVKTTKRWSSEFEKGINECNQNLINCVQECKLKDIEWWLSEEDKKKIAFQKCMEVAKNELQICFDKIPSFISSKKYQKLSAECHNQFLTASQICQELLK